MSTATKIGWTQATWNPVVGCTPVSDGCDNCYAKTLHDMRHRARLAGKRVLPLYDLPFEVVQLRDHKLVEPLRWAAPKRVFVNSMSDLFHKDVPIDFLDKCFAVMAYCRQHTFQILTKRPHRMRDYMVEWQNVHVDPAMQGRWDRARRWLREVMPGRPGRRLEQRREFVGVMMADITPQRLPNVWLGTSVEHQAAANKRIPMLLDTPAAVRFLSCEPLLGPLNFDGLWGYPGSATRDQLDRWPIQWVIIGGESGTDGKRRGMELDWMRGIASQCRDADIAVFTKQDSARDSETRGRIPDDLWAREYPDSVRLLSEQRRNVEAP